MSYECALNTNSYPGAADQFQSLEQVITLERAEILGNLSRETILPLFDTLNNNYRSSFPFDTNLDFAKFPEIRAITDQYIEYFINNGDYDEFCENARSRYPFLDYLEIEEIVIFSIWKSLFEYNWSDADNYDLVYGYIHTNISRLAKGRIKTGCIRTLELPFNLKSEDYGDLYEGIIFDELANEILEKAFPEGDRITEKRTVLFLLSIGTNVATICRYMKIPRGTVVQWINKLRELDCVDTSGRIKIDVGGNWLWNEETAQIILSTPSVIEFLTDQEVYLLRILAECGSIEKAAETVGIHTRHAKNLLSRIKIKTRTNGTLNTQGKETKVFSQRQLLSFLRTIDPQNIGKEKHIYYALKSCKGSIGKAMNEYGLTSNMITDFLARYGWYAR